MIFYIIPGAKKLLNIPINEARIEESTEIPKEILITMQRNDAINQLTLKIFLRISAQHTC